MLIKTIKHGSVFKIESIHEQSVSFNKTQLDRIESDMEVAISQDKCPICILDDAIENTLCGVATIVLTMDDKVIFRMTVTDDSIITPKFLKNLLNSLIRD